VSSWNAAGFVGRLAEARIGTTFNFYREGQGAAARRERLTAYLHARRSARVLLVGEAAGYRGARVSGLPFKSERQLTGSGPAEASASIVQGVLGELGLGDEVLLWNVVPTHPHRPGKPASNRPPTRAETKAGLVYLAELAAGRKVRRRWPRGAASPRRSLCAASSARRRDGLPRRFNPTSGCLTPRFAVTPSSSRRLSLRTPRCSSSRQRSQP
jgi:Uracil DNA glycosylase superfamily